MARLFYTALANTSLHLVDSGLFAGMMSGVSILKAKIGKGYFSVGSSRYKVLVIPFANAILGSIYKKVMQITEANIPVIFFGSPPEFIAENGRNITVDSAQRIGMRPFTLQEYANAYAEL